MSHKIIKRERQEVPKLIDAALLVKAAAGQESEARRVVHPNSLGVAEGLHRKMNQLLNHLSNSFRKQMKSAGIDIGPMQILWRPSGDEQAAYEKLASSELVLELQRLPVR